jgi:hypothetical protein
MMLLTFDTDDLATFFFLESKYEIDAHILLLILMCLGKFSV